MTLHFAASKPAASDASQPVMTFADSMSMPRKAPYLHQWTATEFSEAVKASPHPHFNEVLDGFTKPYFDSDAYYMQQPDDAEYQRVFDCFKAVLLQLLGDQPGFHPDQLVYGQRHGVDPKHPETPYKVSFRAYMPGYKVEYHRLAQWIKDKKLDGSSNGMLDTQPYKPREQLLACMLCCKGSVKTSKGKYAQDSRILKPVGPLQAVETYLVQHLNGDEVELVLPYVRSALPDPVKAPKKQRSQRKEVGSSVSQRTEGNSNETVAKLLEMLSPSRCDEFEPWLRVGYALASCGPQYENEYIAWCKKSAHFGGEEKERHTFRTYKTTGLTLGSLHWWAAKDNPTAYADLAIITHVEPLWKHGDRGLGELAYDALGDVIKLVSVGTRRAYYVFDKAECFWRACGDSLVKNLISTELEAILRPIEAEFDRKTVLTDDADEKEKWEKQRVGVAKVIKYMRGNSGLSAVLALAAEKFLDLGFVNRLDSVRHLLGVRNGVIDLRTGEVRVRQPEDMIRTLLDVEFNPEADTTFINTKVVEMMADDVEMATYLQKLLGYGITGEVSEEIFVFFTGEGRNGKGVLTEACSKTLGTLYREMNVGILCQRDVNNLGAEKAKVQGARLAVFNELKEGEKMCNNEMKGFTGGDDIPCRGLYQDAMSIVPYHLALCTTNELPDFVTPPKASESERLVCVPFVVLFTDLPEGEAPTMTKKQRDSNLKAKLVEDRATFLAWLVQGAVAWYAAKDLRRAAPAKVKAFTNKYMTSQDKLASFISEYCDEGVGFKVSCVDLLAQYQKFLGEPKLGAREVKKRMEEKGFADYVGSVDRKSVRCWRNIKLKNEQDSFL